MHFSFFKSALTALALSTETSESKIAADNTFGRIKLTFRDSCHRPRKKRSREYASIAWPQAGRALGG